MIHYARGDCNPILTGPDGGREEAMDFDFWGGKIGQGSEQPLYLQLERLIETHIEKNELKAGDLLPSEGELCERFHLSRSTVRQALGHLEERGTVIRRRGLGTFVSQPKVNRSLDYLYSFTAQMREMGYETSSRFLYFTQMRADRQLAELLKIPYGEPVYSFERLRLANGVPMLLENTVILERYCPMLTADELHSRSIYELVAERGVKPGKAVETYEPVMLDRKQAELLECPDNRNAFFITRNCYTAQNALFEYTRSFMAGQRSRLEITLYQNQVTVSKYDETAP